MSNKMLIDATHQEETRVVVVRDKRVEDFDFEAESKRPLRGNIYLAKVTRVEPSLQAAFVEYGGNRHGFLAFSEIHPDYYQIPQADRAELLAETEAEEEPAPAKKPRRRSRIAKSAAPAPGAPQPDIEAAPAATVTEAETADVAAEADTTDTAPESAPEAAKTDVIDAEAVDAAQGASTDEEATDASPPAKAEAPTEDEAAPAVEAAAEDAPTTETSGAEAQPTAAADSAEAPAGETAAEETEEKPKPRRRRRTQKSDDGLADPKVADDDAGLDGDSDPDGDDTVTDIGSADAMDEVGERRPRTPKKTYKIQEVIKRRQILLVQVVKEERGTKGAALTTYLSLAGRYSVLMPNSGKGGGVSRKVTDSADRKRLKSLVSELDVPTGMSIIVRTAGASRTKTEIKRDFDYLTRLWESVRELTLKSVAPQLVYEEGNLVKRSIRDLYNKDIDEVLVSGDAAYREAKDFMKMLMPSHAKNVKQYREATPIFTAYAVESQLDAMFSPQVTLPSRGYLVINPTEALVAIDVNSGRSTKEANIEETAYKTNLEAADEVARQLRLRDLAGLIVIDFIDMDDKRHNRAVEKRLKDALKLDRSRIQVGRISPFGLMEMSRQRMRQGMVETSMVTCQACGGTGMVRSTQSVALHCLRVLEEHLLKGADHHVTLRTSASVALYILNQKRSHLNDLEDRFQLNIGVDADEALPHGQLMDIARGDLVNRDEGAELPTAQLAPDAVVPDDERDDGADGDGNGERSGRRRRRRRRRGGEGGRVEEMEAAPETKSARSLDVDDDENDSEAIGPSENTDDQGDNDGTGRNRRRRGRRGGRRHRRENGEADSLEAQDNAEGEAAEAATDAEPAETTPSDGEGVTEILIAEPDKVEPEGATLADEPAQVEPNADELDRSAAPQVNGEASDDDTEASAEAPPEAAAEPAATEKPEEPPRPRRVGWWQRRSFF